MKFAPSVLRILLGVSSRPERDNCREPGIIAVFAIQWHYLWYPDALF